MYVTAPQRNLVSKRAREDHALTASARIVFEHLVGLHCNERRFAWPSQQTLADKLGFCERTIRRAIRSLEQRDYLSTDQQRLGPCHSVNHYHINWPEIRRKTSRFVRRSKLRFKRKIYAVSGQAKTSTAVPFAANSIGFFQASDRTPVSANDPKGYSPPYGRGNNPSEINENRKTPEQGDEDVLSSEATRALFPGHYRPPRHPHNSERPPSDAELWTFAKELLMLDGYSRPAADDLLMDIPSQIRINVLRKAYRMQPREAVRHIKNASRVRHCRG
jgi:DNA-binding transcriptional MocR family regulator